VSVCNLSPNFSCFISTNTFPHKAIVYEACSCASSHTKRPVSVHLLTYETCLCVTFNISRHVFHFWPGWERCTHHFNLRTLLIMQLFYSQDISMPKLCHRRTCLYATCDNFLRVISISMSPRKCVDYEACSCTCSRTKRRLCVLFWLAKTCLCVTFNICQHVCHNRNYVQPHDITYEPFSLCNFSHTKSCLRTLVWPTQRTVMRVHCEKVVPLRNILTYMDVSACTFSHRWTRLYTTCHTISFVCARPTCFHAMSRLPDVLMCVFAH